MRRVLSVCVYVYVRHCRQSSRTQHPKLGSQSTHKDLVIFMLFWTRSAFILLPTTLCLSHFCIHNSADQDLGRCYPRLFRAILCVLHKYFLNTWVFKFLKLSRISALYDIYFYPLSAGKQSFIDFAQFFVSLRIRKCKSNWRFVCILSDLELPNIVHTLGCVWCVTNS